MTKFGKPRMVPTLVLESLKPDTWLELYPLTIRIEDDQYIVGRITTGEFVTLPEVGVRAIELLQHAHSLSEAQVLLREEYDTDVDLNVFVVNLVELGFVKAVDGYLLSLNDTPKPSLPWLQPYHVYWLFSWPVCALYITLLVAAGFTLITHIHLFPRYKAFFWSTFTSVLIVGNTAITLVSIALHELAHLVAARSLGIPANISLSTRLHNLVAQTDVTGLWAVPRRYRYRVYLAGILWELASMSVALLLVAYVPLPVFVQNLLNVLILTNFLGISWQFQFYMRTDIYFVVLDLLHCRNLFEDSLAYLHYRVKLVWLHIIRSRIKKFPINPLTYLPMHERRKVVIYAWLVLVGSTTALVLFAFYSLPILIELFARASASVWQGITQRQLWQLLDGIVTILIESSIQILFVVTFLKNHRNNFTSWFGRQS
ncbi:hypothetical protein NIES2101_31090 [Calothrix sp. HK-06]|nr:hypothetical protein NIES2101_31090 [Calothrix sp. HK-06]